jgi:Enoyl-(Acyl carrier protein) reductase
MRGENPHMSMAPHRIRVNSIAPGAIRTPINRPAWDTPEALNKLMELIPYKRIGEPEDIARAAVWLTSDHADYITGTTLFVDGGMTLYPAVCHDILEYSGRVLATSCRRSPAATTRPVTPLATA